MVNLTVEALEARSAELRAEAQTEGVEMSRLEEIKEEARSIKEELDRRKAEEAIKVEERNAIANGEGEVIESGNEIEILEERKMFTRETVEYRNAFMAMVAGNATAEQRSILADNTSYGDGVALPSALDVQVWDQITTAHPILKDVDVLKTGIVMKVTQASPATLTKKKDSDAVSELTFTMKDVPLVGADYNTYVKLSYAEAKMSQGAMESFLVNDIASVIGEALAKDVFARIIADATTSQKVTATTDMFADVKGALALATTTGTAVVYAPSAKYYDIVGAMNASGGNPFNIGSTLGCQVKLDNAATGIVVVDPKMFVLNVVQDTLVETARRPEEGKIVIGGYMRAEGCLRKTTAASYIA